ncbi:MAG: CAP domain-containing protein [Burkholderiaceae bacterium]
MDPLTQARGPNDGVVRGRTLVAMLRLVAAAALLSALGACGGGGGEPAPAPEPPSPPPAPTPVPSAPIAAQMTVPTPVGYDADRLAAFNRLNEIRLSAGLGMLAQNAAMDQAAQAHADWIIANDSFTHAEVAGTVGFTAVNWWNRDEVFGYVPIEGEEVIAGLVHGSQGVDVLVNGVYHRPGMLAFQPVDVGIGWSGGVAASISMPLVIDITRPGLDPTRGLGQAAQPLINGVAIWPINGAKGVPLRLGLEFPNPVPSQGVLTLGTPLSITVDPEQRVSVSSFTLINSGTGSTVPTLTLTSQNDPNGLVPQSFAAAIPLAPLSPTTTYAASVSGTMTGALTGVAMDFKRSWSFTTATQ